MEEGVGGVLGVHGHEVRRRPTRRGRHEEGGEYGIGRCRSSATTPRKDVGSYGSSEGVVVGGEQSQHRGYIWQSDGFRGKRGKKRKRELPSVIVLVQEATNAAGVYYFGEVRPTITESANGCFCSRQASKGVPWAIGLDWVVYMIDR
jgi:hypothetical protein